MRIAQVAPLIEAVPPRLYGGTERVVAYLTDALVDLGHDVTLFASGDSRTRATLAPVWPRSLRLDADVTDYLAPLYVQLEAVARRAHEFDIIHCHLDYLAFPSLRSIDVPTLTTLHGRLDLPELKPVYRIFQNTPVVSISNAQRDPLPEANFVATVHHGLPRDLLRAGSGGKYLAFLGRISPEKAPDAAIRIAARAGMPLKIAAKVDRADHAYFSATIKPLLAKSDVEFVGEIAENEKSEFLGNAAALLFPIVWREPFGLVMIEAMACGTPVIAFKNGSVPEILRHGVTGFIVDSEPAAAEAVANLSVFDRRLIRAEFESRFTARHMAQNYLKLYSRLLHSRSPANRTSAGRERPLAAKRLALPLLPGIDEPATAV